MSGRTKLELGIVGGFVATVVMTITVLALSALNVLQFAWFPMIGSLFGAPGFVSDAAMYGLGWSLVLGVVWGVIFAFSFKRYSVMKGLGIAGIEFIIIALALSFVSTVPLQGTLLSLSISDSLLLLVGLAVALGFWGATVGFIGKKYLA